MLIDMIMRFTGLGWILDKLNGCKTYIGGAAQLLTGSATILTGAANLLIETAPLHAAADYLHWAQGLSHDPNLAIIAGGAAVFGHGLTAIGLRHAQEKAAAAAVPAPEPPKA